MKQSRRGFLQFLGVGAAAVPAVASVAAEVAKVPAAPNYGPYGPTHYIPGTFAVPQNPIEYGQTMASSTVMCNFSIATYFDQKTFKGAFARRSSPPPLPKLYRIKYSLGRLRPYLEASRLPQ